MWAVLSLSFHTDNASHLFIFKHLFKNNTMFDKSIEEYRTGEEKSRRLRRSEDMVNVVINRFFWFFSKLFHSLVVHLTHLYTLFDIADFLDDPSPHWMLSLAHNLNLTGNVKVTQSTLCVLRVQKLRCTLHKDTWILNGQAGMLTEISLQTCPLNCYAL